MKNHWHVIMDRRLREKYTRMHGLQRTNDAATHRHHAFTERYQYTYFPYELSRNLASHLQLSMNLIHQFKINEGIPTNLLEFVLSVLI